MGMLLSPTRCESGYRQVASISQAYRFHADNPIRDVPSRTEHVSKARDLDRDGCGREGSTPLVLRFAIHPILFGGASGSSLQPASPPGGPRSRSLTSALEHSRDPRIVHVLRSGWHVALRSARIEMKLSQV